MKEFIDDSKNKPQCLILTTKVEVKPFKRINKAFAFKEGEGDRSLPHWRKTHRKFFTKRLKKIGKEFN